MSAFLSSSWHRVAALRPRLQPQAEIVRHHARGQAYYTIRNAANGRVYRVAPASYQLLGLLDGRTTVAQAWTQLAERLEDDAPTQDEAIRLLAQLHDADLLQSNMPPDAAELLERRRKQARQTLWQHVGNPMSLRLPLWDPDRFLVRTLPLVRPLTGWFGLLLWCVVVLPALVLAGQHWGELTDGAADRMLSTESVVLIALVFPVVKAFHEMGHAYVSRAGGGPVHEIGVMFLVLLPIPYVDASAASAFRSRWRRAGVGAAGMLVETFLAAQALYVWLAVEPGATRAVAFSVMLIAGVSTVLFNGNPLLRYDGYFILSDLIGIPNLAIRATRHWGWLVDRFAFGVRAPPPPAAAGERAWFVLYAPASLVARLSVMGGIAMLVANRFFVFGILIAAWTLTTAVVWPLLRMAGRVIAGPALARQRPRALLVSLGAVGGLALLLGIAPAPLHSVADGVVWLPDESTVRAGTEGFLDRLVAVPGETVSAGEVLAVAVDPALDASIGVGRARVAALEAQLLALQFADRTRAGLTLRELAVERAALARALDREAALVFRAGTSGRFVVASPSDLPGRYLRRGDVLGYVLPERITTARVLVRQEDVDLVRSRLRGVMVLPASDPARSFAATLVREVPGATEDLPSPAFSVEGGGTHAVDMRDRQHPRSLNRLFQFDVLLPPEAAEAASGGHVWVRFDHGPEPLAWQGYRRLRQVFLSHFQV